MRGNTSPSSRGNSPAAADPSAADDVRRLPLSGRIGTVSFTILQSRDAAIARTCAAEAAPSIMESLLDASTSLTLNGCNGPWDGGHLAQIADLPT